MELSDGKRWTEIYIQYNTTQATINYMIEGDTLINDKVYKKLYFTKEENLTNWELENFCLRMEDNKLYHHPYECWEEIVDDLVIDANLSVGDSYLLHGYRNVDIVAVGDTILPNGDGISRRYMHVSDWVGHITDTWVDGIGFLHSGFGVPVMGMSGVKRTVLCSHDKNTQLYQNPEYGTCYVYPSSGLNTYRSNTVDVWCIEKGMLVFQWNILCSIYTITLYREDGMQIEELKLENSAGQKQFNGLSKGIYLYKITSLNNEQLVGKVYVR